MKINNTSLESGWHTESKRDTLPGRYDLDCGQMTENFSENWMQCQYWCEGIFFSIVGCFGVMGNIFSILILATR